MAGGNVTSKLGPASLTSDFPVGISELVVKEMFAFLCHKVNSHKDMLSASGLPTCHEACGHKMSLWHQAWCEN